MFVDQTPIVGVYRYDFNDVVKVLDAQRRVQLGQQLRTPRYCHAYQRRHIRIVDQPSDFLDSEIHFEIASVSVKPVWILRTSALSQPRV